MSQELFLGSTEPGNRTDNHWSRLHRGHVRILLAGVVLHLLAAGVAVLLPGHMDHWLQNPRDTQHVRPSVVSDGWRVRGSGENGFQCFGWKFFKRSLSSNNFVEVETFLLRVVLRRLVIILFVRWLWCKVLKSVVVCICVHVNWISIYYFKQYFIKVWQNIVTLFHNVILILCFFNQNFFE